MNWNTFKEIIKVPLLLWIILYVGSFVLGILLWFLGELLFLIDFFVIGIIIVTMFYAGYITTKKYRLKIEAVAPITLFFIGVSFLVSVITLFLGFPIQLETLPLILLITLGGKFIFIGIPCFVGAFIGKKSQ